MRRSDGNLPTALSLRRTCEREVRDFILPYKMGCGNALSRPKQMESAGTLDGEVSGKAVCTELQRAIGELE